MERKTFPPTSEYLYDGFVKQAQDWVKQQAKSIEGNFPTLKDGTVGLKIGYSMSALWTKVLRPEGELCYVDLEHVYPAKDADRPLAPDQYSSRDTLREVQMAVAQVKSNLREK